MPNFLKPKNVVLGGDIRLTSESLKMALSEGIRDAGSDVIDIGMVGTEQVFLRHRICKPVVASRSRPATTQLTTTV